MSGIIESLGLSWQEMLFYAINLAILIAVIRFFVYKPVKKIIDNRKEQLEFLFVENERLNKEALELKKNHEKALQQTRQEVVKMTEEITKDAKLKSQEIIEQAQKKAQEIIQKAKKEIEEEKARAINACKQQVPIVSVEIARQIIQRELNEQDHKKLIEDALSEWEN
ncbi:MAG: F0F1 ATP synthase subunit B [Clostridiales bacterium]|nr:F0F1 ATP synthase subunit B [Clostridiales bacterium]